MITNFELVSPYLFLISRFAPFFNKCSNKINDGEFIYHLLGLALCERFKLKLRYDGEPPYVVWGIVNHYVDNIDMDWVEWLTSDDAPFIRPVGQLKRIFPELAKIYNNETEIVELANKIYGLDLHLDNEGCYHDYPEYVYSLSFDFNSFKPLPIEEIKDIKTEKETLNKYGYDVSELDKKLSSYGLTEDELELI